jgi:aromatic ring-opening dioxygenase LigB subunit
VICFAAIAPHGDLDSAPELKAAMEELGRRFDAAAPDTAIVVTPHNVHIEGHFAVAVAAHVGVHETDLELAARALAALRAEGLPAVGVSYGGNDPAEAELPLDWGTEIPLAFLHAPRIVVVCPARDRPLEEHVRAGAALAGAAEGSRVALVASADHGHAHDAGGPYGFDAAAAVYDALVQEIVGSGRLAFEPLAQTVTAAKADSLWQLLVLQGAVGEDARAELLAYAAPTYYGMLVAAVEPGLPRSAANNLR